MNYTRVLKSFVALMFILSIFTVSKLHAQGFVEKKAGISIRIDDNQLISRIRDFYDIFDKYDFRFALALNLGNSDFLNPWYTDSIRKFQSLGIEIMDHTPNHRTNYFNTLFNSADYIGMSGVDHVNGTKVCLSFETPNLANYSKTGFANISGDIIKGVQNQEFDSLRLYIDQYIYFPSLNQLLLIQNFYNSDSMKVFDVWEEPINLGTHINVRYYIFDYYDIMISQEAYKVLGRETLLLSQNYNLQRPYAWIQPGGIYWPQPSADFVKVPLGDSLEYISGAMYQNTAHKVFNEFNPNDDRRFGMNWGDFSEELDDINLLKKKIADGIAKNKIMIGNNHFDVPSWPAFLTKIDQLLAWCFAKNIPVKTYSQWANTLYDQLPNPATNIFPSIDTDLNEDKLPDGYIIFPTFASLDTLDGPSGVNQKSFSISQVGPLFFIYNLGGIEKGSNDFEIWLKGEPGNIIEVKFTLVGSSEQVYRFSVSSQNWERHTLAMSINGNNTLSIPDEVSVVDIIVTCPIYTTGTIKVSGMRLIKQDPLPVELSSFSANRINKVVLLKWKTSTETNNFGFDVERLLGDTWEKIGFVNGSGNSNSPKEYSFKDSIRFGASKIIYRLKQIDNDGKFTYSKEVLVSNIPFGFTLNQNFPNPFNPATIISFEIPTAGIVKLEVFNLLGEKIIDLVNEQKEAGLYQILFVGDQFASGTYIYRMSVNGFVQSKKMLLLK